VGEAEEIVAFDLPRVLSGNVDSVGAGDRDSPRIRLAADVIRGRACGIRDAIQSSLQRGRAKCAFGHRRSADIAETHKQHTRLTYVTAIHGAAVKTRTYSCPHAIVLVLRET
jgi:hypothetical protein